MTAPFCKTVEEVKSNIRAIEHNSMCSYGPPNDGGNGSGKVINSGKSEEVPPSTKGADWITNSKKK